MLIKPYPGGKGHNPRYFVEFGGQRFSRICDHPGYDVLLDVCLGGGGVAFGHPHGCKHVITSEVDPGVLAVAQCWKKSEDRKAVNSLINYWKQRILEDPSDVFDHLKDTHDKGYFCMSPAAIAAEYLTVKRLVFGGVLRCNQAGGLNVALSKDKLNSFLNAGKKKRRRKVCTETPMLNLGVESGKPEDYWGWQYEWPNNGVETLDVHHGWQAAVQALADSAYENALVVIDPPYYSPREWIEERKDGSKRKSKMTSAYANHAPQSKDELAMCADCLDAVLATDKAGRVVVFNYGSAELDSEIVDRCWKHWDKIETSDVANWENLEGFCRSNLGPLGNMNNAQKFHGRDEEWVWEIGGKRMFQDYDAVEQGDLLELVEVG